MGDGLAQFGTQKEQNESDRNVQSEGIRINLSENDLSLKVEFTLEKVKSWKMSKIYLAEFTLEKVESWKMYFIIYDG